MAKTTKTIVKENPVVKENLTTEKSKTVVAETGNKKIKMRKTYMGPFGVYYKNFEYNVDASFAKMLLKNGDAIECM